ncbi:hypothetical protein [Marinobacterium jannaschii]|uniref:hypothetical protein n=1 Tax=Marinobacterium jannaschii TaxID=64970 RepID=UPI0004830F20|nr:hypothetical protein [Marinobacterium jannaschii]
MRHRITRLLKRLWARIVYCNNAVCIYQISIKDHQDVSQELDIEIAAPEKLIQLADEWDYFAHRQAMVRTRYQQGDRCFLAYDQQRLAHVIWYRMRNEIDASYELGSKGRLPLPDQELILYDAWTPAPMRSRGYYARTMTQILPQCFSISPRVWIYSLSDNYASLRGIENSGFSLRHRLQRIRWFGLKETLSLSAIDS